jgi:hypothetical protein
VSFLLESYSFCLGVWSWRCERNFDQTENLRSASSYCPLSFLLPPSWCEAIFLIFGSPLPSLPTSWEPYPVSDSPSWRMPPVPEIRDRKNGLFCILPPETSRSPKRQNVRTSHRILPYLLSILRTEALLPSSLIGVWSSSSADTKGAAIYRVKKGFSQLSCPFGLIVTWLP